VPHQCEEEGHAHHRSWNRQGRETYCCLAGEFGR
jgi:hypothetical protein